MRHPKRHIGERCPHCGSVMLTRKQYRFYAYVIMPFVIIGKIIEAPIRLWYFMQGKKPKEARGSVWGGVPERGIKAEVTFWEEVD